MNGRVQETRTSTHILRASDHPFVVGRSNNLQARGCFKGIIDDVRVYGRALSAQEVQSHYVADAVAKGRELLTISPDYTRVRDAREIISHCDASGLASRLTEDASLELSLCPERAPTQSAPSCATAVSAVPLVGGLATATFKLKDIPEGNYQVRATMRHVTGEFSASASIPWLRSRWLGSREGYTGKVLFPWTPLKAQTGAEGLEIRFDRAKPGLAGGSIAAGDALRRSPLSLDKNLPKLPAMHSLAWKLAWLQSRNTPSRTFSHS